MRTLERILLLAVGVAIGWFYTWTARSTDPWQFGIEQRDYYNLLIDGWLDGQLHLKVDVPPELLALRDPYDPRVRPPDLGLHDATFYRGKYFLYFGAAPVVVLMLPFRLLTGIDLPLAAAVLAFAYAGFLATSALWLAIRRRYFPGCGAFVSAGMVLTLGLVNLGPVLVRRPQMWELPIAAGYCFATLALLGVWHCLHADRARRGRWLAGAGLMLGLAIASRPTYLLASPLLVVPLIGWGWKQRRVPWRELLLVVAPMTAVGGLMALHNQLRFGDPLQFGQAYQFSLDYESKVEHFSPRYLGFNTWRYFFSAAEWSWHYPFIGPATLPPKPAGFSGHDDVYGVLVNLPLAWFALAVPLALWRRADGERRRLGAWLVAALTLLGVMAGLLLGFFGSLARYQVDFTPTLMLLAAVGVLALERWQNGRGPRAIRWLTRLIWVSAAVGSAAFAVLFSLQMNRFMRDRNPAADRAVAARLNRVPALVARVIGREWTEAAPALRGAVMSGGRLLRLRVEWPRGRGGAREPLLTTGRGGQGDVLVVEYVGEGSVRLSVDHWGSPGVTSETLAMDFSRPAELEIGFPSLATPAEGDLAKAVRRGRVFVKVNGVPVWARTIEFYTAAAHEVEVGRNSIGATSCDREFSGKILAVRRTER